MSGARPASARFTRRAVSKTNRTAASTSIGARRLICASSRRGRRMRGPSPRANSSPTSSGSTIRRISANRIAASTPRRSTGWSVTSAAASGVRQSSRNPNRSRIARYSGRQRPASRMSPTGGTAAANVPVSPGLGNAMGMLYDAMKSGAPLLLTAGQHDQSLTVTEPILWADLPPIAQPFVKWSTEARRLEDLPRIVHRAAKTALTHPTRPVFLSLPVDVLNSERDLDLTAPTRVARRIVGDRGAIAEAARLLANAERPLLVAGDAVAHGDALAELVELAELLGAPVMTAGVASTCSFPFTHPLYSGSMPRLGPPIRALLIRHHLLFSVGGGLFTHSLPDDVDPMPPGITIVHLDVNPWELGKNYPAALAIQGDPKATLPELSAAVRPITG